jgi:O-antigen/teichoic acid export membrane protein
VLGPFVATSIVLAVLRGRLLGVGRIGLVALTFLASVATRLVITLALLHVAPVTGALLATLVGELLALVIAVVSLRGLGIDRLRTTWLPVDDVIRSGVVIGGLFLFTTVDLFLARALLPTSDSGAYVAAATVGKTLLALPAAALAAAYPRLVRAGRGPSRSAELLRTGVVVCGLAALGALVVAAVPDLVLTVLYGGSYPDAGSLVRVLALVAGASSIISLATYALLAVRSAAALLPLAGAVLEVAVIAHWHGTTLTVARGSALATAVTAVALGLALARDVRRRADPERAPAPPRLRLATGPSDPEPLRDPIAVS